jgi:hypothetical protein
MKTATAAESLHFGKKFLDAKTLASNIMICYSELVGQGNDRNVACLFVFLRLTLNVEKTMVH